MNIIVLFNVLNKGILATVANTDLFNHYSKFVNNIYFPQKYTLNCLRMKNSPPVS